MKKVVTTAMMLIVVSFNLNARVKTIKVVNASDSTVKVAIYVSTSPNQLGNAISEVTALVKGQGWKTDYKPDLYVFINAVIIRDDGTKIIVDSHLNKDDSPTPLFFNIVNIKSQSIDQEEVSRMNTFLNEQIKIFRENTNMVIQMDDNAFAAIQEYLGAIAIVDTSKNVSDAKRIKKLFTARQLGLNNPINFSGKTIQNSYRITKNFTMSNNAKFPGIFDADLDFRNSELLEIKYSIINLGSVLYQSQESTSAVDLLKRYDEGTTEPVFSIIANTVEGCKTCSIFQINRVLSFEGIAITGKRYTKSDFGVAGSAASVVTSDAAYKFEEGNEYSDMTSSKVIALSFGSEDLSVSIFTTVIDEIDKDIKKKKDEKSNTQTLLSRIDNDIKELEGTKNKYNGFISKAKQMPDVQVNTN